MFSYRLGVPRKIRAKVYRKKREEAREDCDVKDRSRGREKWGRETKKRKGERKRTELGQLNSETRASHASSRVKRIASFADIFDKRKDSLIAREEGEER